jgi:hypothetical protein
LKKRSAKTVIFAGDDVLGSKGYIAADPEAPKRPSTESVLRDLGLFFGQVEFVKQRGSEQLARVASDRTVRVHTISGAEMVRADPNSNVQRFLLGARERNIRLLFVRLFSSEKDALDTNLKYVAAIKSGLERGRLQVGPAGHFAALSTPRALRLLMGLGLAAGWVLLLHAVTGLSGAGTSGDGLQWARWAAGLGGLLLAALPLVGDTTGAKYAALAAACVFPSLGLLHADLLRAQVRGNGDRPDLNVRHVLEFAFRRLLAMTGLTLVGAALVVGLLADRLFLLKVDGFAGVKLAHLVPLALAALVYFFGLRATPDRPWPRVIEDVRRQIVRLGTQPILLWQVAAALVGLILLAVVVLRSGNDPGVGVSPSN